MSIKMKLGLGASILGASLLLANPAMAGQGQQGMSAKSQSPVVRLANKLDLTQQQRTQIEQFTKQNRQQSRVMMKEMTQNGESIRQATFSDKYNTNTIQQLAQKQGSYVSQMIVSRSQFEQNIFSTLTPQQRTQLKQMINNARQGKMSHGNGQGSNSQGANSQE